MPETGTFYLLLCLECADGNIPLPQPFGDPAGRGRWASEHTAATGHDRWRVWTEVRSPSHDGTREDQQP